MLDFNNPQIWWYLTRASAMVAWVLMTMTLVWGILLTTRILRGADNPEWLKVTHRYMSGLAVVMIAIHIATLMLDEYINFGVSDVLVPFSTTFKPTPVALGIFAFYCIVAIQITALAAKWLPEKLWKGIHLTSYAAIVLVALHSGLVGTDVGTVWYIAIALILITTAMLAGIIRLVIAGRVKPAPRSAASPSDTAPRAAGSGKTAPDTFVARVVDRQNHGGDIAEFILTPVEPDLDLEWDAGAHLTLHLPDGVERQYSLAGDPAEQTTLVLGILNTHGDPAGSAWIHANLTVGDTIVCDLPRNNFKLKPAPRYQFIASGIGITPLRSMLFSLPASREWSLLYIGKNDKRMLFAEELVELFGDRVTMWKTSEKGFRPPLGEMIDPAADVYACGTASLLETIEHNVAPKKLNLERFTPKKRGTTSTGAPIEVVASRSGITTTVAEDSTILEALESSGVSINSSCLRGVCGSCEVSVLAGTPEHLDSVMSDADKDELGVMYPCVSRSLTPSITLDV